MDKYLEFGETCKFTVSQFNKLYMTVFGEKKTAKKYLSDMIAADSRLSREKMTIYGAYLCSIRELKLKDRIIELETQVAELQSAILEARMEETEDNVELETRDMEIMEAVLVEMEVEDVLLEIVQNVEQNVEQGMDADTMEMELESKQTVSQLIYEKLAIMKEEIIIEKKEEKEEPIAMFMIYSIWDMFFSVVRNNSMSDEELLQTYIDIKYAELSNHGINTSTISEDLLKSIKNEGIEYINGCKADNNKDELAFIIEHRKISEELKCMEAEDRHSARINNIMNEIENNKKAVKSKNERKAELKRLEEEEEKKYNLFAEKYLIGDKVEICDFNPNPLVKTINAGGEMVEVTVKYGDNNTYSYDGKKYKKVGYLYLEIDENGSTGKAEYYLKKDFHKITLETYQADISLEANIDWSVAQDKQAFISYEIINWLDYYTYEEMYEFTKCEFWLNKKKWDAELLENN